MERFRWSITLESWTQLQIKISLAQFERDKFYDPLSVLHPTPPHSQCFLCLTNFGQCFCFLSPLTSYPKQQGKKETNNKKPEWKAQKKEISNSCLHWIVFSGYWWEEGRLEMSNKVLPSFTRLTIENGHFVMTHLTDVLVSLCFAYSWNITPDILSQIQPYIYCN